MIPSIDHDSADIDGDGEFDAIDIVILEESKDSNRSPNRNTGCCLAVLIGSTLAGVAFAIGKLIT